MELKIYAINDLTRLPEILEWCKQGENRARLITSNNFSEITNHLVVENGLGIWPLPTEQAELYWGSTISETAWPE